MAYNVRYRRRAEIDLEKLAQAATLERFDGLLEAIERLEELPERCAFCPEPGLRRRGVRQLLYGEGRGIYRVVYCVKNEDVEILTIRHAHRRPMKR